MSTVTLTLFEARRAGVRYVVRPVDKAYRVYDTLLGSYPYARPGLGKITQDVPLAAAEAEAARLNGGSP